MGRRALLGCQDRPIGETWQRNQSVRPSRGEKGGDVAREGGASAHSVLSPAGVKVTSLAQGKVVL